MAGRAPPLASPSIPGLLPAGWKTALLALGAALPPLYTSVHLYRRLRTLRRAVLAVLSAPPDSRAWVAHRLAISDLLRQGNTYMTWSLALVVDRSRPMLYTPLASAPDVAPAELGVTASSTPTFLKALDLGGGDQRKLAALLDAGDTQGAEKLLADRKEGGDNRCFILTGGPLARRQQTCQTLAAAFPSMVFVALHPEAEGRMTLRSGAAELMRLATASGGAITHVLLVAKGSTDLHIAWLRAEGGVALGDGCAASEVHRLEKTSPSSATEIFTSFVARAVNAELVTAAEAGTCAVVFAGASIYAIGQDRAAQGRYLRPLAPAELRAAEAAEFERFVGLEWCGGKVASFVGCPKP